MTDTTYLVLLVTHLKWPGFLGTFLASCSLQQIQVKRSINTCELMWLSLWQTTPEYLQKQNVICSSCVLIEPTIEQGLIIEVEEKPYCPLAFVVWWHGYKDYGGFSKHSPWKYWPKKLFTLTSWGHWQKNWC